MQQIGVTPLTSVAMSSDCNPLNDLSAVADYASKASVGAGRDEIIRANRESHQRNAEAIAHARAALKPTKTNAGRRGRYRAPYVGCTRRFHFRYDDTVCQRMAPHTPHALRTVLVHQTTSILLPTHAVRGQNGICIGRSMFFSRPSAS